MHSARHRDCPAASRLPLFIAAGSRARLDKRIDGQSRGAGRERGRGRTPRHLACAYSNPSPSPRTSSSNRGYDRKREKGAPIYIRFLERGEQAGDVDRIKNNRDSTVRGHPLPPPPIAPSKSPFFRGSSEIVGRLCAIRGPLIRRGGGQAFVRNRAFHPEMKKSRSRPRLRERNKSDAAPLFGEGSSFFA